LTPVGRSALERARQSGISVALDDFGTGHGGLMQIVNRDFDILKIDHSESILSSDATAAEAVA
jgi:sensor c-di-GMP phosphodiesterase-like protein